MDQICSRPTSRLLIALLLSGLVMGVAWAQAPKTPAATPTPAESPSSAASKPAGPTIETAEPPDKVVLKVGDQQFTKADIDFLIENLPPQTQQAIATKGKKPLGDQYALIVLLSQQAQIHHLDQTPAFVHKLAFQRQQLEAQTAFEEINQQAKVTPEELQQYYTAHAADYDAIVVRQIVVRKKAAEPKADPAHPTASTGPGFAPEEAKARAEAIRKELAAGTDIKKVMDDFKAPGDVIIEGEPRTVRRGGMRPDMEKVAFALKDGEVSEPVDVPQALVFFQVTGHNHEDLKAATPDIEKALQKQKVDAAMAEVKKSTNVWMDEQYFAAPPTAKEGPTMGAPQAAAPKPNGEPPLLVMNYLAAAGTLRSSATRAFLSTGCKDDMVTEFQANEKSGWSFSGADTKIVSQTINAAEGKATVVANVVFKGGSPPTFMGKTQTFFLVLENGVWKISRMDPAPKMAGPGVSPL